MRLSLRHAAYGFGLVGLLAAAFAVLRTTDPIHAAPSSVKPLERVPADAFLFAHLRADGVWNHPAVVELRKAYAKELGAALKEGEALFGLTPESIETITVYFPKFPMGGGPIAQVVFQVETKKPYDKDTVLKGVRGKEMPKGDFVKLGDNGLVLHFVTDRLFSVVHESVMDDYKKAPATEGPQAANLKAAREGKDAVFVGVDPSGLPDEIFANAPAELQPFLPLLKSKSIGLKLGLDKELKLSATFVGENADKAIESERSFNLLMKLADDGLTEVLKDSKNEELMSLRPMLEALQKVAAATKAKRTETIVSATASFPAEGSMFKPLAEIALKPFGPAARTRSANNLKQIGLALHNYHDANGVLPPAAIVDKKGKPLLSWRVAILPYIEQDNLYKQFKLDEPWDSEHNLPLSKVRIKTYILPYLEDRQGETHYRVFVGNGAGFDTVQGIKFSQFTDGTSNTLLVFESSESTPWAKPDEIEFDPKKPVLKHFRFENNRCNFLFADGSVRAVSNKVDEQVLKNIIQRDDGNPIGELP